MSYMEDVAATDVLTSGIAAGATASGPIKVACYRNGAISFPSALVAGTATIKGSHTSGGPWLPIAAAALASIAPSTIRGLHADAMKAHYLKLVNSAAQTTTAGRATLTWMLKG